MVKKLIEKIKIHRLNKLGEQLTLLLNANSDIVIKWITDQLTARDWRLIHKSEMDELLEDIDNAVADSKAALQHCERLKNAEAKTIINEYLYGAEGDE